jgi:hypothetical protein
MLTDTHLTGCLVGPPPDGRVSLSHSTPRMCTDAWRFVPRRGCMYTGRANPPTRKGRNSSQTRRVVSIGLGVCSIISATTIAAFGTDNGAFAADKQGDSAAGAAKQLPPALSPHDREVMDAQAPLMDLGEKVLSIATKDPNSGFAGTSLDLPHRRLHVYWSGPTPSDLEALRTSSAGTGVFLDIHPAAYSQRQLMTAADQLGSAARSAKVPYQVDVAFDGSRLTVTSRGLRVASEGKIQPTAGQSRLMHAIEELRSTSGVAVEVDDSPLTADNSRSAWATRLDDTPPGGAERPSTKSIAQTASACTLPARPPDSC